MKKVLIFSIPFFMFSCATKPKVAQEQREAFEYCKKTLVENKLAFIAQGKTPEKKDSLAQYIEDLEKNSLEQLLEKYDVEEDQVIPFVYSVCQNADAVQAGPSVEETMKNADSMMKVLDSIIVADSLKKLNSK